MVVTELVGSMLLNVQNKLNTKMKKSIIIVFLLLGIQISYAQTNEKEAYQFFKQAREAYQNGNYSTSARLLLKT
jgi:intracellular sulfur oxidation DsrE/DsrF family protein